MATSKDCSKLFWEILERKLCDWVQATVFPQRISQPPPIFPTTPNFPSCTPLQAVTKQSSHPWSRKLFRFVLKKKQLPQINAGHTVIFGMMLRQHHTSLKIQGGNFILNFHSAAVTLDPYYNITETKKNTRKSNLMWGHFTRHIFVSSVRSSSGYHGLLEIRQRSSSSHFFRFFKFFRF